MVVCGGISWVGENFSKHHNTNSSSFSNTIEPKVCSQTGAGCISGSRGRAAAYF